MLTFLLSLFIFELTSNDIEVFVNEVVSDLGHETQAVDILVQFNNLADSARALPVSTLLAMVAAVDFRDNLPFDCLFAKANIVLSLIEEKLRLELLS